MRILFFFAVLAKSFAQGVNDSCRDLFGGHVAPLHSFTSPGYPEHYPPNMDCTRVIHSIPGYDIVVTFKFTFQIETSYNVGKDVDEVTSECPNDFVEFRDGRYGFSPLIGRFCGMHLPQDEIRAKSGFLWVRFHSDDMLEYKGFFASYEMIRNKDRRTNQHDCHIEYKHGLDGYLETRSLVPTLPFNFTGGLDCIWLLEVPKEYQIVFYINEFSLYAPNQCTHNFLEIYSGAISDRPIRRYCGLTASTVFSAHHLMYIRFYVDDTRKMKNITISAHYSSYLKKNNCTAHEMFSCGDENCVPLSVVCNGRTNCPYGKDESACHIAQDAILHMISSSYSPLIFIVLIVFIVVVGLFIWHYKVKDC